MNQRLIEELMRVLGAVAAGELNQTMTQSYPGVLAQLKQTTNDSVAKLNTSMVEIRGAIHAAAQGVLDKRVDLGGKQGFFHELGENLNHNLDMNQQLVEEVMRVFAAVAVGDLSQTMTQNYAGTLAQLKADVNISIGKLSNVMHEIRDSINAAGQGIFDRRIDLNNKAGFFRDVSENLNRNLDTNQKMVEELMRIFAAMANGDLSQSMQDGYLGKLAELKKDVNSTIAKLNQLFEELIRVFSAMSTGDLTQNIHQDYTGRLAELKRDVMDTLTKLNQVVGGVGQASKQVHAASEEVSHGTLSLSERTEEQAAALEETSSSMQEMTDTVQRNSDNAQEANLLSINARKHAEEGSKVVGTAIVAISEINKSSRRMSDIISVIDEIAFQTNLLALNAAVEAARAGEQGRGFAVVATEVRNLAQRSSAAAKEIKGLIQDTMNKIEDGTQAVNQSGQTLEEIVLSTKKVSDIVAEIAAANQEQSAGILQVNKAVTQMDEMTEQNAALVEELSGNSESMREQAGTLNQLLDFFKSEGNEQHRSKLIQNSPQHDGETPPSTVRRHQEVDHHTTKPTATRPKKKSGNSSYSHPMSAAQRHEADKETEWENF
jgi:methyl-accepting chemotaxis protein